MERDSIFYKIRRKGQQLAHMILPNDPLVVRCVYNILCHDKTAGAI